MKRGLVPLFVFFLIFCFAACGKTQPVKNKAIKTVTKASADASYEKKNENKEQKNSSDPVSVILSKCTDDFLQDMIKVTGKAF